MNSGPEQVFQAGPAQMQAAQQNAQDQQHAMRNALAQQQGIGTYCDCHLCQMARQDVQAAGAKAQALLESLLDCEQIAEYREQKRFLVRGNRTGNLYRILAHGSLSGNVLDLNNNRRLCAALHTHLGTLFFPFEDHIIAQFLMLKYDEGSFLKIAH